MSIYQTLPQLNGKICITDGGLETDLLFNQQLKLPEFAAYDLLRNEKGYSILFDYYKDYAELARRYQVGLVLETPTWRANADWGQKIGDAPDALHAFNTTSVTLLKHIRAEYQNEQTPIIISGCLGPRGDGYSPGRKMTTTEAARYHSTQIETFSSCGVDMVAALTLNYIEEAIGITRAANERGLPVCISFTVEVDGKLPTGETLEQAILAVDKETANGPLYYMINCAHPTHFEHLLNEGGSWLARLKGVRGNASCLSHAELDESEVLDDGNPEVFGKQIRDLAEKSSHLTVLGGCCGTDHRHIEQVCRQLVH